MVVVSDTCSDQACERKPECDSEQVVNGTGAHGKGSGLDVVKMISIDADSTEECRQSAHMDAPIVRRVCACVDGACLALRAIEEVVREDAGVNHGKGSNDGRGLRPGGSVLADDRSDVGVSEQPHECDDAKTKSPNQADANVGSEGVFHGLVSFVLRVNR